MNPEGIGRPRASNPLPYAMDGGGYTVGQPVQYQHSAPMPSFNEPGRAFNLLARDGTFARGESDSPPPLASPRGPLLPNVPPPYPSMPLGSPAWPALAAQPPASGVREREEPSIGDSLLSLAACNPLFGSGSAVPAGQAPQPAPPPAVLRAREIPSDDPFIIALFRICVRASTICNMRHAKDNILERRRAASARGGPGIGGIAADLAAQEREVDRELEGLQREQAEDTRRLATAWAATCVARDDLRGQCSALQQRLGSVEEALIASNNAIVQSAGSPLTPVPVPPNQAHLAAAEARGIYLPARPTKEEIRQQDGFFSSLWRMIVDSESAGQQKKQYPIPGVAVEEAWNGGVQLTSDAWRGFVTERQALIEKLRRAEGQLEYERQQRRASKSAGPVLVEEPGDRLAMPRGPPAPPAEDAAARLHGENGGLREEIKRLHSENGGLRDELKRLRMQLDVLAAQSGELREQRDGVQARLEELVRAKGRVRELEADSARLAAELEQARSLSEARALEAAAGQAEAAAAREKARQEAGEGAAAREKAERLADRLSAGEREAAAARAQAEQYRELAARTEDKAAALEKELANLQQQNASLNELAARGNERVAALEDELSRFRLASLAAAGEAAGRFRECIRSLEAKVRSAEEENARLLRQAAAASAAAVKLLPAGSGGSDDGAGLSSTPPWSAEAARALDSARSLAAASRPLAGPTGSTPPGVPASPRTQLPAAPLLQPSSGAPASSRAAEWIAGYPSSHTSSSAASVPGSLGRAFGASAAAAAAAAAASASARTLPSSITPRPHVQRPASSAAAPFRASLDLAVPAAAPNQQAGAELRDNLERLNERLVRTRAEWEASMSEIEGLIAKAPTTGRPGVHEQSSASSPGVTSARHTYSSGKAWS